MTSTVLKHPLDAWTRQSTPADNRGKATRLVVTNASGDLSEAWLFFGSLPTPGVYVTTATLHLYSRQTWPAQTLTVKRVTQPWKEKIITYRNRPATTTSSQSVTSVGQTADSTRVDLDVTAIMRDALLGTGSPFYGFVVSTSSSSQINIRSSEDPDPQLRPRLRITYSKMPVKPTDLVPGDGSYISTWSPVLRWTFADLDGDDQVAYRVQVDNDSTFTSPTFDSGWVTSADPQHMLT